MNTYQTHTTHLEHFVLLPIPNDLMAAFGHDVFGVREMYDNAIVELTARIGSDYF